ncbi:MAG: ABC transporter C-terminal domain-containing protein, partial [Aeromicrobium sp.]
ADLRMTKKEIASIDRKLAKMSARIDALHVEIAEHDQSDFPGLSTLTASVTTIEEQMSELEHRWIELSELVDS